MLDASTLTCDLVGWDGEPLHMESLYTGQDGQLQRSHCLPATPRRGAQIYRLSKGLLGFRRSAKRGWYGEVAVQRVCRVFKGELKLPV